MPLGIRETGRLAIFSLLANPLRSLLTSLGIIIGVLAVVGMSSLIEGLDRYVTAELSQVGSDNSVRSLLCQGAGFMCLLMKKGIHPGPLFPGFS